MKVVLCACTWTAADASLVAEVHEWKSMISWRTARNVRTLMQRQGARTHLAESRNGLGVCVWRDYWACTRAR
eukprot:scaffold228549_cov21-Tisochrysis_lutea.AAC.2